MLNIVCNLSVCMFLYLRLYCYYEYHNIILGILVKGCFLSSCVCGYECTSPVLHQYLHSVCVCSCIYSVCKSRWVSNCVMCFLVCMYVFTCIMYLYICDCFYKYRTNTYIHTVIILSVYEECSIWVNLIIWGTMQIQIIIHTHLLQTPSYSIY